jgi:putative ABC transport system ATP-binding protein
MMVLLIIVERMITIEHIEKYYRTENLETLALNSISFTIQAGEFVAIMGPSGCGKSTLLNILGMLDYPDKGKYYFMNQEVSVLHERQRSALRKHNVGFVFQSFNLIDELSVFENIEMPLLYSKWTSTERRVMVNALLDRIQLTHRRHHYPQQLSGGQQQRVAVARALVCEPKFILADEPTGNLDSRTGTEVMELLSELNEKGTTIIMVTHSEHDANYAHRIINMLDGQVVNQKIK